MERDLTADWLHREHEHLSEHIENIRLAAGEVSRLSPQERKLLVRRILDFVSGTLLPHAEAEESGLAVEARRVLGTGDQVAAIVHDHGRLVEQVDALAQADLDDGDHLTQLLNGLHTLIKAHFRLEEQLELGLADADSVLIHEP